MWSSKKTTWPFPPLAAFHHHMKAATCHTFGSLKQWSIVVVQHLAVLLNLFLERENERDREEEKKERAFSTTALSINRLSLIKTRSVSDVVLLSSVFHWAQWLRHIQYTQRFLSQCSCNISVSDDETLPSFLLLVIQPHSSELPILS